MVDTAEKVTPTKRKTRKKKAKRQGQRNGAPAVSLLDTLHAEHVHMATLLDSIETQLQHLRSGTSVDFRLLLDMVHYFYSYPDKFHHPREDLAFTYLIDTDRRYTGYIKELELQHRDMHTDCRYLHEKLEQVVAGSDDIDLERLAVLLQDFVDFQRMHMDLEEGKIFPALRQHLSDEQWAQVERDCERLADPLFGDVVDSRYANVIDYIRSLEEEGDGELIAGTSTMGRLLHTLALSRRGMAQTGSVIRQRSRLGWEGNKRALQRALDEDEPDSLMDLPGLVMRRNVLHMREGMSDVMAVWRATGQRVRGEAVDKSRASRVK